MAGEYTCVSAYTNVPLSASVVLDTFSMYTEYLYTLVSSQVYVSSYYSINVVKKSNLHVTIYFVFYLPQHLAEVKRYKCQNQ